MESSCGRAPAGLASLTLAALGVVFGDIGTSPLYALQSVFAVDGGIVQRTEANVYGVRDVRDARRQRWRGRRPAAGGARPADARPDVVLPLTVATLTALFAAERWGTERIGGLFGPVMLLWFGTLALAGIRLNAQRRAILRGLSPTYALSFLVNERWVALVAI